MRWPGEGGGPRTPAARAGRAAPTPQASILTELAGRGGPSGAVFGSKTIGLRMFLFIYFGNLMTIYLAYCCFSAKTKWLESCIEN